MLSSFKVSFVTLECLFRSSATLGSSFILSPKKWDHVFFQGAVAQAKPAKLDLLAVAANLVLFNYTSGKEKIRIKKEKRPSSL